MAQKEQNIISYTSPGSLQTVDWVTKLMSTVNLSKTTDSRSIKQDNNVIDIKKRRAPNLREQFRYIAIFCRLHCRVLNTLGCVVRAVFTLTALLDAPPLHRWFLVFVQFKALTFGHSCSLHNEDIWSVIKLRIMPSLITPVRMFADGRKDPLGLREWLL